MKRKIIPLVQNPKSKIEMPLFCRMEHVLPKFGGNQPRGCPPSLKSKIQNRIFLAPMEEVNDPAFRMICKKAGAALTYTPLTSPLSPIPLILEDKPILQIFGDKNLLTHIAPQSETKKTHQLTNLPTHQLQLGAFMQKYDELVAGWDFNLGCPAATAKNHKFGAYLENPKAVEEIIFFMRKHTKKPLSIKIRKSDYADEYLKIAEKYCDAIAIHPRTKEQGYSGDPDWDWAKKFKEKAKIPVIYSGNVDEKNYKELLRIYDYLMIGRNAIGHPEIFAKITGNKKFKRDFKEYLKLAEKYKIQWRLIKFQAMQFTKGEEGSRQKRAKMARALNLKELKEYFLN
jgi:tRNA-dihydrouridine synthase